jgi:hypothetical protein
MSDNSTNDNTDSTNTVLTDPKIDNGQVERETILTDSKNNDKNSVNKDNDHNVPENSFTLTLKDNSLLDENHLESLEIFAKANNFNQEKADELYKTAEEILEKNTAKQAASEDSKYEKWLSDSKNDPEFGRDSWDDNVVKIKSFYDAHQTKELTQLLEDTGIQYHPEVLRLFYRLSKIHESFSEKSKEDVYVANKPASQPKSIEQLFYPDMAKS